MEYRFRTRKATLLDYSSIANLSRRAVGPNDYVLGILKQTIKAGGLFIALDGQRVIGMANYQELADRSGWLSMARTDPDYRGKRVAGLLQEAIARYGRSRGVEVLRMLINSSNTPSINSARRGGFKPATEVAHVTCSLRRGSRDRRDEINFQSRPCVQLSELSKSEDTKIAKSGYLRKMNGFFGRGWHVEKWAQKSVVEMIISGGEAYRSQGSIFILGSPPEEVENLHGEFAVLTGTFGDSVKAVKQVATSSLRLRSIGTFLPFDPYLIRVAKTEHGFHVDPWADHGFIFEKWISR